MKKLSTALILAASIGLVHCDKQKQASTTLDTEVQKYSYALGNQFGSNLGQIGVEIDEKALMMAVNDVLQNKESKMTEQEVQEAMVALRSKRMEAQKERAANNQAEAQDFLEKNKTQEGVKVTDSGLQYKVLEEGTGKTPTADSRVKVHYSGTLIDGSEFDSSYKRGAPAVFGVGGVIKGWTEALQMMKEGAKWKLYIPADLAYGSMDRPSIPANSVLIFDVELIEVLDEASKE